MFTHSRTGPELEASLNAADNAVQHDAQTTLEITVGNGGDFATITGALEHLRGKVRGFAGQGRATHIRLLTGFIMSEQVICDHGVDLSWITIVADDAQVTLARSAITVSTTALGDGFASVGAYRAAFMGGGSARMPRLGCKMAMDASGTANDQSGIFLTHGAYMEVMPGAGIDDTVANGAHVMYGAQLVAPGSTWDGNGTNTSGDAKAAVRADWQGFVSLQQATITNQQVTGVAILGASTASLRDASITNCGEDGLEAGGVAIVHARGLTVTGAAQYGIFAAEGSRVRLLQNTIDGCGTGLMVDGGSHVNSGAGTSITNSTNYGIRCRNGGQVVLTDPTITTAGVDAIRSEGGEVQLIGGQVTGGINNDLYVNYGGRIRLLGVVATTSGSALANNLADSNVSVFGCPDSTTASMIYGRGGRTKSRGSASIASGTTSVTIPHNVDPDYALLPEEISVSPADADAAALDWYITNVSATTFDIACVSAPAAQADFVWHAEKMII